MSTASIAAPAATPSAMPLIPGMMTGNWTLGDPSTPMVISSEKPMVRIVRVAILKPDGTFWYDQVLICEEGGAAIIMYDPATKRIALRKQFRFQALDYQAWTLAMRAGPMAMLCMIATLGRVSYEVVRGFPLGEETAAQTAGREGDEESEFKPVVMRQLATMCSNTTFNPHSAAVFVGECDMTKVGSDHPDPNEAFLDKTEWFTWADLQRLKDEGTLYCGFTLSAILLLLLDNPLALD